MTDSGTRFSSSVMIGEKMRSDAILITAHNTTINIDPDALIADIT
jgi:hypothetical protein